MVQLSPGASKAATLKKGVKDRRFFPELVWAGISGALGKQRMFGHLAYYEASLATGDLQRRLTTLVLTDRQLVIGHTNKQDTGYPDRTITGAEVAVLRVIHSVMVIHSVYHPEEYPINGSQFVEAQLTLAWGAVSRLSIGPATCEGSQCEVDHGWTGMSVPNDLTVRISPAGDGWQGIEKLIAFDPLLQEYVGRATWCYPTTRAPA